MKVGYIICSLLLIILAVLSLAQLWLNFISSALFIKLSITFIILFIVCLVITLVVKDYKTEQELKDKGYID